MAKIKYYIDEKSGIVRAVMNGCRNDVVKLLHKSGYNNVFFFNEEKYYIRDTYKGVAKLDPRDTWDVNVGMKIARERLLEKYYYARCRVLGRAYEDVSRYRGAILDYLDYSENKLTEYNRNN